MVGLDRDHCLPDFIVMVFQVLNRVVELLLQALVRVVGSKAVSVGLAGWCMGPVGEYGRTWASVAGPLEPLRGVLR